MRLGHYRHTTDRAGGEIDPDTLELLKSRVIPIDPDAVIKPTLLYPKRNVRPLLRCRPDRRQDVATENAREFAKLTTPIHRYFSADVSHGDVDDIRMKRFLEPVQAVPDLALREGAQVMLVRRSSPRSR